MSEFSTIEQSEKRQIIELREKAGVEKFFVDKVSAKSAQHSKFDEMMNFLREGDELIVSEFSRLVPSTNEMVSRIKKYTLNIRKIFQIIKGISLILSKHTGNYSKFFRRCPYRLA